MDRFDDDLKRRFEEELTHVRAPEIDPTGLAKRAARVRLARSAGAGALALVLIVGGGIGLSGLLDEDTPAVEIVLPTPDRRIPGLSDDTPSPGPILPSVTPTPSIVPTVDPTKPPSKPAIEPPGGPYYDPVLSTHGRWVAFGAGEAYVYDRKTNTFELASVSNDGEKLGLATQTDMTPDGRYVTIPSHGGRFYVRDMVVGKTTEVSLSPDGEPANREPATPTMSISDDGRYVVFVTTADNLVPGDTNGVDDVFVRDMVANQTRRLSVSSSGEQANGGSGAYARISGNGRFVTFTSDATNLGGTAPSCSCTQAYVHDLVEGTTTLVSKSSLGQPADSFAAYSAISDDGRYVVYLSAATNLVVGAPDTDGTDDIFLHDRQTGETTNVTDAQPSLNYAQPVISADGTFVGYTSAGSQVWVHDVAADTDRAIGSAFGTMASFSNDNQLIAYSNAENQIVIVNLVSGAKEIIG